MRILILILAVGGVSLLMTGQPSDCEAAGYCNVGEICSRLIRCGGSCVCMNTSGPYEEGVCVLIENAGGP